MQHAEALVDAGHQAGDHRLAGAGIAREHHVQRHVHRLEAVLPAQLVDGDGVDELFVLRRYIKPMTNAFGMSNDYYSTLENFNLFAIQHSFISESYRIKNNKVEELLIDNEPVSTQAFGGGHFGVYYYLLDGGRIAMYSSSYWDENLKIYNNLELETTILHIGNMETSEWEWKVNGKKSTQSKVSKILKEIVN